MSGFLYALLAALLAGVGARDGALVAQLGAAQGRRPALLLAALLAAAGSAALAAWLGGRLLGELAPAARALFAALALVLAGGEMVLLGPRPAPAEPTHSLGATVLVLLGQQITDAARFLVLALAVSTAAPWPAGLGGALGSMAGLAVVWTAPGLIATAAVRHARRLIGAGLLVLGLGLGLPNVLGLG